MFEFLVVGEDIAGALVKIATVFSNHHVNICAHHGYAHEKSGMFVHILFCDFSKADCLAETVGEELKLLPFVKIVRMHLMDKVIFEKFLFPIEVADGRRAVLMRLEPLVDIERRLTLKMGSGGSAIMFDAGKHFAIESLVQLKETLGNPSTEILLQNLIESFKTGGWGILEMKEKDGYEFTVVHPPSNSDRSVTQSRFLFGMVAGSLEMIYDEEFVVAASTYDKKTDTLWFKLKRRNARV